jgi:hypothetical protein
VVNEHARRKLHPSSLHHQIDDVIARLVPAVGVAITLSPTVPAGYVPNLMGEHATDLQVVQALGIGRVVAQRLSVRPERLAAQVLADFEP